MAFDRVGFCTMITKTISMLPCVIQAMAVTNMISISSLSYADDLVLLAPTAVVIQDLIRACEANAAKHDVFYNTTKTACMAVPPTQAKVIT